MKNTLQRVKLKSISIKLFQFTKSECYVESQSVFDKFQRKKEFQIKTSSSDEETAKFVIGQFISKNIFCIISIFNIFKAGQ